MKNLLFTLLVILTIAACSQEENSPSAKTTVCKECSERYIESVGYYDTLKDETTSKGTMCSEEEIKNFEGSGSVTGQTRIYKFWIRTCK